MSDKDQHTPMYSSSDIEKYLNGELSAPEMHALERAALDDPFLADALDGIMIHRHLPERPPFQEDVAQLQQRLQNRVTEKGKDKSRVRPLFMRYAAAVILLAGLGLTAYYTFFNQRTSPEPVAQSRVPSVAPPAVPAPATESAPTTENTPADKNGPPLTDASQSLANTRPTHGVSASESGRKKAKQSISEALSEKKALDTLQLRLDTSSDALTNTYASQPDRQKDVETLPKPTASLVAKALAFRADKLVFSGKVTDPHNNPLPGAYLALKNNQNINAVTDKNGFFNLRLNNKIDTSSAVLVNHVGYEQGSMLLNTENRKGNFIQLQPQAVSLNEVEIVGYGAKRTEIMRQNIDAQHKALSLVAVPAAGWPAYKEYLGSSKQSANLDSTLRGDETISFIVNRKGELSSFKVEQSISPAHDSATIQMIKQGPAWQLLSGKKARARVILTY